MRFFLIFLVGILFGVVLIKGEIASWYRIQEMFRFQSFHMYGVIGSAVVLGAILVKLLKMGNLKGFMGVPIKIKLKEWSRYRYILGGIIFGLGWGLVGVCPGPMYALIGSGFTVVIVVFLSALLGTFVYGLVRHKLPH